MSKFKYGASLNCTVGSFIVGGAGEGCHTLDYMGNDLTNLIDVVLADVNDDNSPVFTVENDHELVGEPCEFGSKVVGVVIERQADYGYVVGVIFDAPDTIIAD